jgi:electron transfer flavoprotein beta subunit
VADVDVVALIKVVPTRVDVDALSGVARFDPRFLGVSAADRAALAVAAELASEGYGSVDVYCVGPPAVETALLEIAALGFRRTVRVGLLGDETLAPRRWLAAFPSSLVARVLAAVIGTPDFVVCGDHSLDRGSGSVPARVAERLGYAQALGLLDVNAGARSATRRLDAGWRERVRFGERTVISVEAGAGALERAGLGALRDVELELAVVNESVASGEVDFAPYRPANDVVAPPREKLAARRAMEVIGALAPRRHREVVAAEPAEAAEAILERLAAWGYR